MSDPRNAAEPLTLSLARGATDVPLIEQTIGAFFDAMVARQPDHEALVSVHQGRRYTYRALQADAHRLASALLAQGLNPGDRVGIWSHNNAEWVLMQLATAQVGLVLVNINPAYRTSEVEYALNKVGCKLLVTMARFKTSDYLGMLRELAPEWAHGQPGALEAQQLPHLKTVVWIDEPGQGAEEPGLMRFSALLDQGDAADPRVAQVAATIKASDPINIQFTSGTTGFPKGATLTHRNILNNGFFIGECMKLTPADRLCIPVPLYHCFGMVLGNLACFTHGATIVYPNDGFDPLTVLQTVQDERCTGLHGVPTMFIAELDHPRFKEFDLSTLRTGIMAGSPCPTAVMQRVVNDMHLSEITIAYGMTETSPVSCQSSTDTPLDRRVSTVGTVQPHLEVKIVNADSGEVVAPGQSGELCTRGYSVMHGYWDDPVKTAEAIDTEGWMHTGDLATMDTEGYVNIVGRIKDMVIRGGENIYPREIEEFLYRHPAVQDVQVVGVPDAKYGEELCAWVIVKPGQALDEDTVRAFCKGQIAHYKVPRYIRFVDAFPMTVTGKIQKFKIRDAMKDQLGLAEAKTA
ncbi:MAG: AMP-binding protein [Hydrogenophaga sp.]|jgi:fatty-acyl-CoA synthase|uniref:AMP-binding protein n=1 Tax=Hydrogenophaga sp. TaxID=1904254 RepID=UPI0008B36627|nr:AMP-binding protein [Hydrogenophaga sp.]MBU4180379.1 AMP-binding protein [Gammaproteobacteria bacterium]OGB35097.1 MAG: AMP-binding protein [Burkholderiales bacterium RIFCSPLOWO2_02_FULL_66_35]MBU4282683.1 AMP-binding protein [Gammaproteobacteria bacterium]MBU4324909.1 AMP-binding protein [Gammaproteobacteria bacterium]MCG2654555.1 AMP-binding protein [Hydrogenophaga sp.]